MGSYVDEAVDKCENFLEVFVDVAVPDEVTSRETRPSGSLTLQTDRICGCGSSSELSPAVTDSACLLSTEFIQLPECILLFTSANSCTTNQECIPCLRSIRPCEASPAATSFLVVPWMSTQLYQDLKVAPVKTACLETVWQPVVDVASLNL